MCVSSQDSNMVYTSTLLSKILWNDGNLFACYEINLYHHQGNISPQFSNFMVNPIYVICYLNVNLDIIYLSIIVLSSFSQYIYIYIYIYIIVLRNNNSYKSHLVFLTIMEVIFNIIFYSIQVILFWLWFYFWCQRS